MASHASVQFGEEQKSPPRRPSSEISEGTYSGVRSALRVLRSYDTVPYCARF
jgi:hypothetical protein